MALRDAAHAFAAVGCSVVPARPDGTKAPAAFWKQYQQRRPTTDELHDWLDSGQYDGIGLICGTVSGNLEMLELEGRAVVEGLVQQLQTALTDDGFSDLWTRLWSGYAEATPSEGLHFLYRVDGTPRPNLKLARRPATADELALKPAEKVKVLIETRGQGGYVIVAPSAGRTHPTGKAWGLLAGGPATIPTLSEDERDTLHAIASTLDRMPAEQAPIYVPTGDTKRNSDGARPGDAYNAEADWSEILDGWTRATTFASGYGWRRPGKDHGISATTGTRGEGLEDRLYVFSTSTEFETETPYSKFGAYAVLKHGGDHAAAARELRRRGYGAQDQPERVDPTDLIIRTADGNVAHIPAALPQPDQRPSKPHLKVVTEQTPGRRVALTPASQIKPKPVHWLWTSRLAMGSLALLAGKGGLGKSTIAYWIAARLSRGELDGEYYGSPRAVIVAAAEDSWEHTIVPRLIAAGANLDLIYRVEVETSEDTVTPISFPKDNAQVEAACLATGAALILLDPLMSRIGANLDTHKDAEVRQALEPIVAIAGRVNAVCLGLIHVSKAGRSDPTSAIMGSAGFANVARAVLMAVPSPDDDGSKLFGQPKNNLGRTDLPTLRYRIVSHWVDTDEGPAEVGRLEWEGETDTTIEDAMRASQDDPEERLAANDAKDWLVQYLTDSGGTAPSDEVFAAGDKAGHAKRTIQRAKSRARISHESVGFPRRTVWALPSGAISRAGGLSNGANGATGPDLARLMAPVAPVAPVVGVPPRDGATNGAAARALSPGVWGPCRDCGKQTQRYGPGGNARCETCRSQL